MFSFSVGCAYTIPAFLNPDTVIATPALIIPKAKNIVVSSRIEDAAPVTLPALAAVISSATGPIRLTPTRMTMKPPNRFANILYKSHPKSQFNKGIYKF